VILAECPVEEVTVDEVTLEGSEFTEPRTVVADCEVE
jgi:hypothetical protein